MPTRISTVFATGSWQIDVVVLGIEERSCIVQNSTNFQMLRIISYSSIGDGNLLFMAASMHKNPLYVNYSSHRGYLSKAKKWNWLSKHFVLHMPTGDKNRQIQVYKQFMAQEQDRDLGRILDSKSLPSMLGDKKFITWIKDRFFKMKKDKQVPASKQSCKRIKNLKAASKILKTKS